MRLCLGIGLVLVALPGCGDGGRGSGDRRAFASADSWYAPPMDFVGFTPIDNERFAPVATHLQLEAQNLLTEVPAKRLTSEEATRLVGRPLPTGGEYVLLRAVVLFEGTGRFNVRIRGTTVYIHHGCLGHSPAPMGRKALVAVLPAVPETVFVSCSMAE